MGRPGYFVQKMGKTQGILRKILKGEEQMKQRKETELPEGRPLADLQAKKTDPQGSWTGVPADRFEKPVQDADDL